MTSAGPFFRGSRIYEPVALLRREDEILIVARVGMPKSQRFMIFTPAELPAWPHEPLGSLSHGHFERTSGMLCPLGITLRRPERWPGFWPSALERQ